MFTDKNFENRGCNYMNFHGGETVSKGQVPDYWILTAGGIR